jgi:hypothetical protein
MDGLAGMRDFLLAGSIEILHADGDREVGLEGVVDIFPSEFFKGGAGGVEVPIVVMEVHARILRAASGLSDGDGVVVAFDLDREEIDAGVAGDELFEGGVFFDRKEGTIRLLEIELNNGFAEVDSVVKDVVAVEHGENALAYGSDFGGVRDVPVREDHVAVDDDHHGGGGSAGEPRTESVKAGVGITFGLGANELPIRTGKIGSGGRLRLRGGDGGK